MTPRRFVQLVGGCAVLGVGVSLLLGPALGSDGYSTLVNGVALATGWPFLAANALVSGAFVLVGWLGGVRPSIGTLVQIVTVGVVVTLLLPWVDPAGLPARAAVLAAAIPVVGLGIALYLDSDLGAGPAEAPGLAFDPPVPFVVSYSLVQGGGALVGWLLGAAVGPGTLVVVVALGPVVGLVAGLLRLDVRQGADRGAAVTDATRAVTGPNP